MSNIFFSPIKLKKQYKSSKITNRPFSSIPSRTSFQSNNFNINNEIYPITDKRNIKYIIENNLFDSLSQKSTKITNTRNYYNKLRNRDLRGKVKYSNFK